MAKIFISYRRIDSADISHRIYQELSKVFGAGNVFMDVHNIPEGKKFPEVLTDEVVKSNVMLVIIGKNWLTERLWDADDFVRYEVNLGLRLSYISVIPVVVADTPYPTSEKLPETLRDLAYLNAKFIRPDPDFNPDLAKLVETIKSLPSPTESSTKWKVTTVILAILSVLSLIFASFSLSESGANMNSAVLIDQCDLYERQHEGVDMDGLTGEVAFARETRTETIVMENITPTTKSFYDIFWLDLETCQQRQLTTDLTNNDTYPQWSPDGNSIVYVNDSPDVDPQIHALEIRDYASGISIEGMINPSPAVIGWDPTYDPATMQFVSHRWNESVTTLYRQNNPDPIVSEAGGYNANFTDDGQKMVYLRDKGENREIVLRLGRDIDSPEVVLTNKELYYEFPRFSPDETRIAYSRFANGQYDIFMIDNVDQIKPDSVVDEDAHREILNIARMPEWINNNQIIYIGFADEQDELFIASNITDDVDNIRHQRITNTKQFERNPAVRP